MTYHRYESGPTLWMADAACKGMDANLFHPTRGEVTGSVVATCRGCPVQPDCLAYAVAHPALEGWWGGTSERERARLRRQKRKVAA